MSGVRVHRLTALTTNDVRVLRALVDGSLTDHELRCALARQSSGPVAGMRRLPGLLLRGYVVRNRGRLDVSVDGVRALRAADHAAYGWFA